MLSLSAITGLPQAYQKPSPLTFGLRRKEDAKEPPIPLKQWGWGIEEIPKALFTPEKSGDTFVRNYTSVHDPERTITSNDIVPALTKPLPDTVKQPEDIAKANHFLIYSPYSSNGKTTEESNLQIQLENKGIKTVTAEHYNTEDYDKNKKLLEASTKDKPMALLWDEIQTPAAFMPLDDIISPKILNNPNVILVATVTDEDNRQAERGSNISESSNAAQAALKTMFPDQETFNKIFPQSNQWILKKSTPEQLLDILDFMIRKSGYKVLSPEQQPGWWLPLALLSKEQRKGHALSNEQRKQLLENELNLKKRPADKPISLTKAIEFLTACAAEEKTPLLQGQYLKFDDVRKSLSPKNSDRNKHLTDASTETQEPLTLKGYFNRFRHPHHSTHQNEAA